MTRCPDKIRTEQSFRRLITSRKTRYILKRNNKDTIADLGLLQNGLLASKVWLRSSRTAGRSKLCVLESGVRLRKSRASEHFISGVLELSIFMTQLCGAQARGRSPTHFPQVCSIGLRCASGTQPRHHAAMPGILQDVHGRLASRHLPNRSLANLWCFPRKRKPFFCLSHNQ